MKKVLFIIAITFAIFGFNSVKAIELDENIISLYDNSTMILKKSDNVAKGCNIFGEKTTPIVKWAINLIRIGGVVLVVVFGVLDFVKILLSGEEKNFKESGMRFVKRLIALVLLIFIPYVLAFLLDLSGVLKQYGIEDVYCVVNF